MAKMTKKREREEQAEFFLKHARKRAGEEGWHLLGLTLQQAMVCQQVLMAIFGQLWWKQGRGINPGVVQELLEGGEEAINMLERGEG